MGVRNRYRIAWVAWQEHGDLLEGKAGVVSAAFFKEAPASFDAEMPSKLLV